MVADAAQSFWGLFIAAWLVGATLYGVVAGVEHVVRFVRRAESHHAK